MSACAFFVTVISPKGALKFIWHSAQKLGLVIMLAQEQVFFRMRRR